MRSSGFSIVELLVVVFVGALLIAGLSKMMTDLSSQNSMIQATSARDELVRRLRNEALTPLGLRAALAENPSLRDCLTIDSPDRSLLTCLVGSYDLRLRGRPIAGNPGRPLADGVGVNFGINGEMCTPAQPICVFNVRAQFSPVCPSNAPSCDRAGAITVTATVEQRPGSRIPGTSRQAPLLKSITERITLYADQVQSDHSAVCAVGLKMVSRNPDGSIVCQPASGDCGANSIFQGVNAAGVAICIPKGPNVTCGKDGSGKQLGVSGINADGTPNCAPDRMPIPNRCFWSRDFYIADIKCPDGYVVRGLNMRCGPNSCRYQIRRLKCCN